MTQRQGRERHEAVETRLRHATVAREAALSRLDMRTVAELTARIDGLRAELCRLLPGPRQGD